MIYILYPVTRRLEGVKYYATGRRPFVTYTQITRRMRRVKRYLDVVRCQVSLHVAVLLFGRGRGWLVGRWEVSPVKRVKR